MIEDVLQFVATLRPENVSNLLLAGGPPRSGTTYYESLIHAAPSVLTLQESPSLQSKNLASFLKSKHKNSNFAEANQSGLNVEMSKLSIISFNETSFRMLLLNIADTTLPGFIVTRDIETDEVTDFKDIEKIKLVACKAPFCEHSPITILNEVCPKKIRFVYVFRDLEKTIRSNWQMVWTESQDPAAWIDEFLAYIEASRLAVDFMAQNKMPIFFFHSEAFWQGGEEGERNLRRLMNFASIADEDFSLMQPHLTQHVDFRPPELRRKDMPDITPEMMQTAMSSQIAKDWTSWTKDNFQKQITA